MTLQSQPADIQPQWVLAGSMALVAHIAIGVAALNWTRQHSAPQPEPVVLVDLPPPPASMQEASIPDQAVEPAREVVQPVTEAPRMEVPVVRAPLPSDPVVVPPSPAPRTEPARPLAAPANRAAPAQAADPAPASSSNSRGSNPQAQAREADYFALVSAHLNRRKRYPTEAKKALQQGIVTIRFTVARDGSVSNISIKRSSGHELLDQATLELLARVAPLPRMPSSMERESVTLSLPIEYSLKKD